MDENVKGLYLKTHVKVSWIAANIKVCYGWSIVLLLWIKPLSINFLINTYRKLLLHKSYIINIHQAYEDQFYIRSVLYMSLFLQCGISMYLQ